jgi:quinol monooxygenase YgiN
MVKSALFVKLEAKPGKEKEVEQLLMDGLHDVEGEEETISWYAVRTGFSTFAIFDTFQGGQGLQAHLTGPLAKTLTAKASQLLMHTPTIERADVLAAKTPEVKEMAEAAY